MNPDDLLAFRRRLGLTQAQAGEKIGATRRTWQDWETGRRTPPGYLARALRDLERELMEERG